MKQDSAEEKDNGVLLGKNVISVKLEMKFLCMKKAKGSWKQMRSFAIVILSFKREEREMPVYMIRK